MRYHPARATLSWMPGPNPGMTTLGALFAEVTGDERTRADARSTVADDLLAPRRRSGAFLHGAAVLPRPHQDRPETWRGGGRGGHRRGAQPSCGVGRGERRFALPPAGVVGRCRGIARGCRHRTDPARRKIGDRREA